MPITQSNFQSLKAPRFQKLSQDQLECIHFASLEILERTGVRLLVPEAVDMLKSAGLIELIEHEKFGALAKFFSEFYLRIGHVFSVYLNKKGWIFNACI